MYIVKTTIAKYKRIIFTKSNSLNYKLKTSSLLRDKIVEYDNNFYHSFIIYP